MTSRDKPSLEEIREPDAKKPNSFEPPKNGQTELHLQLLKRLAFGEQRKTPAIELALPKVGIAEASVMGAYVDELEFLYGAWAKLDVEGRRQQVKYAIDRALEKAGVPWTWNLHPHSTRRDATFVSQLWTIVVPGQMFADSAPTKYDFLDFATKTFHEAVHLEQQFRAARLYAERGVAAEEIMRRFLLPREIVDIALRNKSEPSHPLTPRDEQIAKVLDVESNEGKRNDQNNRGLLEAGTRLRQVYSQYLSLKQNRPAEAALFWREKVQPAIDAAKAAGLTYYNAPHERDAWDIKHAMRFAWEKKYRTAEEVKGDPLRQGELDEWRLSEYVP